MTTLLKVVIQRALNANREIIACFIDYEKVFDRINHDLMIKILKKYKIGDKDLQVIKNLYWSQKANLKIGTEYSKNKCSIKRR